MGTVRTAVVIGGGIGGTVTAMALARAGIEATVHEAYPGGADGVGAMLSLAPNGLAALRIVGRNPAWIGCTVAGFGAYWATTLSTTWLPAYFTKGLGFDAAATGALVAVTPAISIAVMLIWAGVSAGLLRRGVATRWARAGLVGLTMVVGGACTVIGASATTVGATVVLVSIGLALSQPVYPLVFLLISEVSPEVRRRIKAMSYGLAYGLSSYGLSAQLKIST